MKGTKESVLASLGGFIAPWDIIDLEDPESYNRYMERVIKEDTVENMRKYIKEHQEVSPYSKTGGRGLAGGFISQKVSAQSNKVFRINSLNEIPIRLYGKQVFLYLKDSENTIVIKHLFINIINGKVLADYDIDKYQVIGYCENLDL